MSNSLLYVKFVVLTLLSLSLFSDSYQLSANQFNRRKTQLFKLNSFRISETGNQINLNKSSNEPFLERDASGLQKKVDNTSNIFYIGILTIVALLIIHNTMLNVIVAIIVVLGLIGITEKKMEPVRVQQLSKVYNPNLPKADTIEDIAKNLDYYEEKLQARSKELFEITARALGRRSNSVELVKDLQSIPTSYSEFVNDTHQYINILNTYKTLSNGKQIEARFERLNSIRNQSIELAKSIMETSVIANKLREQINFSVEKIDIILGSEDGDSDSTRQQ